MGRLQLGPAPSRPGDGLVFRTVRTPEQYGAAGDGVTNDQTALQAMLDALRPGDTVRMAGRYRHSGVLTVPVPDTTWYWTGVLLATNRLAASLRISTAASGTTMYSPRHIVDAWNGTGNAREGDDSSTAPFAIYDTSRITLVDPYSANSAQCGFYLANVKGYTITRPVVDRSYADGFHQTHNCEDGRVIEPTVMWPGDDGVAIVSYLTRSGAAIDPCRRIVVESPTVRYTHARGLSVVGGTDITFLDVDVWHTRAAGIYFAGESSYNTHPPVRARALGGRVAHVGYPIPASGSATPDAGLDHGALFMLSQQSGSPATDCLFQDIEVADFGSAVFSSTRAVADGGTFSGCAFRRITLQPGPALRSGGLTEAFGGTQTGVVLTDTVDQRTSAAPAGFASTFADVNLGSSTGDNTLQTIPATTFTKISLGTEATDAGNNFNPTTNLYTVPADGLYTITARLRPVDGNGASTQVGMGVDVTAADGPFFAWQVVEPSAGSATTKRRTLSYQRTATFTAGQQLQLYAWTSSALPLTSASMTILRVA